MKLIGLTGPSGSGKGYIAACFAKRGIDSIDTDAIVHRLYREDTECIAALERAFGSLQDDSGAIDRRRLREIVFADREKLAALNAIVHCYVRREVERICQERKAQGCRVLLLDAPQLYEAGMEVLCDQVIAVIAPQQVRLQRVCTRDHIDAAVALQRFRNQHSDAFFQDRADFVICNDGASDIEKQTDEILEELTDG